MTQEKCPRQAAEPAAGSKLEHVHSTAKATGHKRREFLPARLRRALRVQLSPADAALERDLSAARRRAELRGDAALAARLAEAVATLRRRHAEARRDAE